MFMMGMELEDTSISFLGCPYSAWLRRVKRNSLSRYFLSLEGRREERESRVRRSKSHVTCLVVAGPRGDDGGEMFLFSQGRRRGVLSLLACNRNMFLIGEEGWVMVSSWQGRRGVSRLLSTWNRYRVGVGYSTLSMGRFRCSSLINYLLVGGGRDIMRGVMRGGRRNLQTGSSCTSSSFSCS